MSSSGQIGVIKRSNWSHQEVKLVSSRGQIGVMKRSNWCHQEVKLVSSRGQIGVIKWFPSNVISNFFFFVRIELPMHVVVSNPHVFNLISSCHSRLMFLVT